MNIEVPSNLEIDNAVKDKFISEKLDEFNNFDMSGSGNKSEDKSGEHEEQMVDIDSDVLENAWLVKKSNQDEKPDEAEVEFVGNGRVKITLILDISKV